MSIQHFLNVFVEFYYIKCTFEISLSRILKGSNQRRIDWWRFYRAFTIKKVRFFQKYEKWFLAKMMAFHKEKLSKESLQWCTGLRGAFCTDIYFSKSLHFCLQKRDRLIFENFHEY